MNFNLPDPKTNTKFSFIEEFRVTPDGVQPITYISSKHYHTLGGARGAASWTLHHWLIDVATGKQYVWSYKEKDRGAYGIHERTTVVTNYGRTPVSHYIVRISTYENGVYTVNDTLVFPLIQHP